MQISLTIHGLDKLKKACEQYPRESAKGINDMINRVAVYLEGQTKEHITKGTRMWKSPIDTGEMRRGLYAQRGQGGSAYVKSSGRTPYAVYVHEGTGRMRARPFFEITVEESKKDLESFIEKEISNLLNKVFK